MQTETKMSTKKLKYCNKEDWILFYLEKQYFYKIPKTIHTIIELNMDSWVEYGRVNYIDLSVLSLQFTK